MITASCEHCSGEGAPVACIVGSYGLCLECFRRMEARGLLQPLNESDRMTPFNWDDLKRSLDRLQETIDQHFPPVGSLISPKD